MKASAVLAVAASLGSASATFFHNAPSFSCPGNTNNQCLDEYRPGLNWQDLTPGKFDKYKGFRWKGFQAVDKFSKRSELGPRQFQDKSITGKAKKSRDQSPKMSCDVEAGNEKTTIREIQIETAFDCDLEFHYTMPGGSICKQRHHCPKSGTTVPNNQCGGATDVTIVYPHQPQLPQDGCDFAIPSIGFDCDDNTPPTPPVVVTPPSSTYPVSSPPSSTAPSTAPPTTSSAASTTSSATVDTYTTVSQPGTTSSTVSQDTYSVTVPTGSVSSTASTASTASTVSVATTSSVPGPQDTYSVVVPPTSSVPGPQDTYSVIVPPTSSVPGPQDTYSVIVPTGSHSGSSSVPSGTASTSVPGGSTSSTLAVTTSASTSAQDTPSYPVVGTSSVPATTPVSPPTGTTTYPVVDTSSVPATTPVSPPSDTTTTPGSPPSDTTTTPGAPPSGTTTTPGSPPADTTTYSVVDTSSLPPTTPVSPTSNTASVPAPPLETAPCPPVVPSCLNTWMFIVQCIDNTDSACYCPDEKFVTSVFDCMYAHGETDDIIKEAVEYFQGICAPYVPQNPAIGTGADTITPILTVTATAPPTAVYTTIEIVATSVVPCTDAQGVEIPSSSSTITYSTTLSVPEVHFSTITNMPGSTQVAVVPGPTVYPTAPAPGVPPRLPLPLPPRLPACPRHPLASPPNRQHHPVHHQAQRRPHSHGPRGHHDPDRRCCPHRRHGCCWVRRRLRRCACPVGRKRQFVVVFHHHFITISTIHNFEDS
ncbi:hypothetical protein MN608_02647 [Microdochium nivale]|nr:hypothetical protein MN608_02647 [Microdochium nivale]